MDDEVDKVLADREMTYGGAEIGFAHIGKIWADILSVHLGLEVEALPPHVVGAMNCATKLVRLLRRPDHLDSYVDNVGYATLMLEIAKQEK